MNNGAMVQQLTQLYDEGRYLDAFGQLQALGPLRDIQGTDARLIVMRLAWNLGGGRLAQWLQYRAYRDDRTHPTAIYYFARHLAETRGPLAGWRFLRAQGDLPGARPDTQADWLALHGTVLSHLRDFTRAAEWYERAAGVDHDHQPARAWLCVERTLGLQMQDRYDEALALARESLELAPRHRPGVQAVGHLLGLLGRDEEALAFLQSAVAQMDSGLVLMQLVQLQQELGMYAEARANLEQFRARMPLMDQQLERWLLGSQCDAAYYCGDFAAAIDLARQRTARAQQPRGQRKDDYYEKFGAKLAALAGQPDHHRVKLPVGFTRQHHMTCAPATLSTLSRYWNRPHEHLEIAARICYDGTPPHADRRWANEHGFVTREFTVTWDAGVALIDRGVPFAVDTVDPGRGHAQAIIGYDKLRGTLLIRDPFVRQANEFIADKILEHYAPTGPRGLVLVPADKAHLLDGVDLPDAALYDRHHDLQGALERHDRPAAQAALDALEQAAHDHRITLYARRALAIYDTNINGILAANEALLQKFPDDGNIQLSKLACLRDLAQRDARLALLQAINRKQADPLFWQRYAQELASDARQYGTAGRLLRRALRYAPGAPANYHILGHIRWGRQQRDEALELYRFAACIGDKEEQYAHTYFQAAAYFKRTDEVLAFLRRRYDRLGGQSSQPAQTLFDCYESINQSTQAFAFLEDALDRRPDDGELALFAANAFGRYGQYARGMALLHKAKGQCHPLGWLLRAAELAEYQNQPNDALAFWRQVLERDPLNLDGHSAVARLVAETEGRAATVAHLRQATERFPYHFRLHRLLVQWLQNEAPDQVEAVLRQMLQINPDDAWTRRELASVLAERNAHAQALAEARYAQQVEPHAPSTLNLLGFVHLRAGHLDEARQWYEKAVRQSVDDDYASAALLRQCRTTQERRDVLRLIQDELVRQVIFGDGLLAFRLQARATLESQEVLDRLREAWQARPDLWHAWSALLQQLISMHQLDEALALAQQAGERFALLPRIWMDIADVHEARQDYEGCIAALTQGRMINPRWSRLARRLAGAHEHHGNFAAAREVLEQAITLAPLDGEAHAYLSYILWMLDHKDQALDRLQQALLLNPYSDAGWNMLRDWCRVLNKPELAVTMARQVAERRPGEAHSWVMLARVLPAAQHEERLATVEKALALVPGDVDAHDLKATILAEAKLYDKAALACQATIFGAHPPTTLQVRHACVMAERGHVDEAIALVEKVLQQDQSTAWGWQRLMEWYRKQRRHEDYLRAAQRYTALFPRDAAGYEYLGDALVLNKDSAGARPALQQALQADPTRDFAPVQLFDLAVKDNDLAGARAMLDHLRQFRAEPGSILWREVKLAAIMDDLSTALDWFKKLVLCHGVEYWMIRRGLEALHKGNHWMKEYRAALLRVLPSPDLNKFAGAALIDDFGLSVAPQDWATCRDTLNILESRRGHWHEAAVAYLDRLGRTKSLRLLRQFTREKDAVLRADPALRGETGLAFGRCADHAGVVAWFHDWNTRTDLRPGELYNLGNGFRELGRQPEARVVALKALELPQGADHAGNQLFVAADELAYAGVRAPERLQHWGAVFTRINPQAEQPFGRCAYFLLKPLTFEKLTRKDMQHYMKQARLADPAFLHDRILCSIYQQVLKRFRQRTGGPAAWYWYANRVLSIIFRGSPPSK